MTYSVEMIDIKICLKQTTFNVVFLTTAFEHNYDIISSLFINLLELYLFKKSSELSRNDW